MNRWMIPALLGRASIVAAISLMATPAIAELPSYQVKDLGTLGVGFSQAAGINASGHVVGSSYANSTPFGLHAFLHDGTTMRDLGALTDWPSEAKAINERGYVVGILHRDNETRGFVYDGVLLRQLPSLGGTNSYASDIDNDLIVVGSASISGDAAEHAVLYYPPYTPGAILQPSTLAGTNSRANGINEVGGIVGTADTAGDAAAHAFVNYGGARDLGTLGGTDSNATAVNDDLVIVGSASTTGDAAEHAFLYELMSAAPIMRDLGTLGGTNSRAWAINASRQVVGESDTVDGSQHAFLYEGTVLRDLNQLINPALGWVIWSAVGINDLGQIAGTGLHLGEFRAVLLTPIPVSFAKLLDSVSTVAANKKLSKPATLARASYEAEDLVASCAELTDFNRQVQKLPEKKITQTQADDLIGQSQAIMHAIGCP